jgi:hypothetical protein
VVYLRELVTSARLLPAPFGLINKQTLVSESSGSHWTGGFSYDVEAAALYATVRDVCDYTITGATAVGNAPGSAGAASTVRALDYAPFMIEATDGCRTSFGMTVEDRKDSAVQALELITPKAVEREFWENGFSSGNTAGNRSLKGTTPNTLLSGTAVKARRAIAALDQALADDGAGLKGAIHVTRDVLSLLRNDMNLEEDADGILWSPAGNMLIGGVGYTGNGASGRSTTQAWAFATGPVQVLLSPIQVSDEPVKVTGLVRTESYWDSNTLMYTADRFAAVTFNGNKVHAVLVDIAAS